MRKTGSVFGKNNAKFHVKHGHLTLKLAAGYFEYFLFYFFIEESRETDKSFVLLLLKPATNTTNHDLSDSFDGIVHECKKMYQCRRTSMS